MVSKPLTDLLKKGAFDWSESANEAFNSLKNALISTPVLAIPNFSIPFEVETDASKGGIGAVLIQVHHPIAYISRALGPKWQTLTVNEKEVLALVFAVQKWEQYLMGAHFIIRTDQKSLKWPLQQKISTPFQQFWLSKLMGFDYEIQYKNGKENLAADALSRVQVSELLIMAISVVTSDLESKIHASYLLDSDMMGKITKPQQGEAVPHYSLVKGILKRHNKIVVGPDTQLRSSIISWHHGCFEAGHVGRDATAMRVK